MGYYTEYTLWRFYCLAGKTQEAKAVISYPPCTLEPTTTEQSQGVDSAWRSIADGLI